MNVKGKFWTQGEQMDLNIERSSVRREILKRRKERANGSSSKAGSIRMNLTALPDYRDAGLIHCYVSIPGEVDTWVLIGDALRGKKRIVVPFVRKGETDLLHSEISDLSELIQKGGMGLYRPSGEIRPVDFQAIDLVIVPGVAFDRMGNRLGFGRGYYDRFLKKVGAIKVGLAFEFQILDSVPMGETDVPVDLVVTEEKVHRRR